MYIQDLDKPALFINELKRELKLGKVGLIFEDFAPAHFANFRYDCRSNPPLKRRFLFMCSNYCSRYRPAAREAQSPDTETSHIRFRSIKMLGNNTT